MEQDSTLIQGVPSGYPSLDKITGGWQNSNLIVIASRPSVGKSAFAQNIACNAAVDCNIPVAYFSLEMTSKQFVERTIIQETGASRKDELGYMGIDASVLQQKEGRLKWLSQSPLYIDDTPGLTVNDFCEKAKELVEENNVGLMIIDPLQLMTGPEDYRGQREEEVAYIVRNLKTTAKELNVPIIVLAQLSRNTFSRYPYYKKPELSHLRENGSSIEETADLVLLIHRPDFVGISEDPSDKEKTEIIIAKNRNGSLAEVPMLFKVDKLRFEEPDIPFHLKEKADEPLERIEINSRVNPRFSFDNFTVAECNAEAVEAAKEIVEFPIDCMNTTLLLVGEYGSGKTHLVNAMGNMIKEVQPNLTVLYVSGEDFKRQHIEAVNTSRLTDFKNFYEKIDFMILDNIQDLLGAGVQNSFFHLMDSMQQRGKRLVITSALKIDDLKDTFDERMLEHLSWGKTVEIKKIRK